MIYTVVITTYNRAATVLEAIDSVRNLQRPLNSLVKTVVVDDGSRDGSFEKILEAYGPFEVTTINDETIAVSSDLSLLRLQNGERGRARNRGAEFARKTHGADWFLFLDSDDCLVSTALVRFDQSLRDHEKVDICYSWCVPWSGVSSPTLSSAVFCLHPDGDLSHEVLGTTFLSLGATLLKAEGFFSSGMFPEERELSGSEDKILLTRMAFKGRAVFCRQVATWYRQHESNTDFEKMCTSIDLTTRALRDDINSKFGVEQAKALAILERHGMEKKIGYGIYTRHMSEAFHLLWTCGPLDTIFWKLGSRWLYRVFFKRKPDHHPIVSIGSPVSGSET